MSGVQLTVTVCAWAEGPLPTVDATAVTLSPAGRTTLADFMGDFKTPFNIVVGSNLLVQTGDAVPSGRLVVKVNVKAHAGV